MDLLQIFAKENEGTKELENSYGLMPILNAFANLTRSNHLKFWDLYLINIETLIRDRKNNTSDITTIARNILNDCNVLVKYIGEYARLFQRDHTKNKIIICFYMNKYEALPDLYIREKFPKGTEERWKIRDKVAKMIDDGPKSEEGIDVVFSVQSNTKVWPHKEMVKDLIHNFQGVPFMKALMISHIPLDFHLYRTFSDFTILESYTGAFKTQKQFGKKVFGNENLPFNKYTHLLFGDKWYIKPLVEHKTRKLILDKAIKEHWTLLPDKAILKSLVDMHLPLQDLFINPEI